MLRCEVDHAFGAARCFRRDVVEQAGWKGQQFQFWTAELGRTLDVDSQKRVNAAGFSVQRLRDGFHVLDIKSSENLSRFSRFDGARAHLCEAAFLSQEERASLERLLLPAWPRRRVMLEHLARATFRKRLLTPLRKIVARLKSRLGIQQRILSRRFVADLGRLLIAKKQSPQGPKKTQGGLGEAELGD
jgi:hypothetical protein